ncbi:MAG: segregation/condensation protein A [archaeon]
MPKVFDEEPEAGEIGENDSELEGKESETESFGKEGGTEDFGKESHQEIDPNTLEAVPQGQEKQYLVDLIDQPAWKSILIELVKSNKMDPWNIDVVELADLYWQKIQQLEKQDLRIPANAILASAILLKLKARSIKLSSVEEEDETEAKEINREELAMIEEAIPELRGQRQFREGRISLDELVASIGEILEKTKQKKNILRDKQLPEFRLEFNKGGAAEQVDKVFTKIRKMADSQGLVMFSALLEENTPIAMINCFIPILFLANSGKINAWQEEWFGEIFISLMKEAERKE